MNFPGMTNRHRHGGRWDETFQHEAEGAEDWLYKNRHVIWCPIGVLVDFRFATFTGLRIVHVFRFPVFQMDRSSRFLTSFSDFRIYFVFSVTERKMEFQSLWLRAQRWSSEMMRLDLKSMQFHQLSCE